jgi:hypothetical protein
MQTAAQSFNVIIDSLPAVTNAMRAAKGVPRPDSDQSEHKIAAGEYPYSAVDGRKAAGASGTL